MGSSGGLERGDSDVVPPEEQAELIRRLSKDEAKAAEQRKESFKALVQKYPTAEELVAFLSEQGLAMQSLFDGFDLASCSHEFVIARILGADTADATGGFCGGESLADQVQAEEKSLRRVMVRAAEQHQMQELAEHCTSPGYSKNSLEPTVKEEDGRWAEYAAIPR